MSLYANQTITKQITRINTLIAYHVVLGLLAVKSVLPMVVTKQSPKCDHLNFTANVSPLLFSIVIRTWQ